MPTGAGFAVEGKLGMIGVLKVLCMYMSRQTSVSPGC